MLKPKEKKPKEAGRNKAVLGMDSILRAEAWHDKTGNPTYEVRGNAGHDKLSGNIQR